jgi:hypothetical protein
MHAIGNTVSPARGSLTLSDTASVAVPTVVAQTGSEQPRWSSPTMHVLSMLSSWALGENSSASMWPALGQASRIFDLGPAACAD